MKTFYIETFGCQMNAHDSEKVIGTLVSDGYTQVPEPEQADLVLYNTCSIRDKAEQKVFHRLNQFKKEHGKGKTFGVLGCVAQQEGERIFERAPFVSLVAGSASYSKLSQMLVQLEAGNRRVTGLSLDTEEAFETPFTRRDNPHRAYITIIEGCDKSCAYCVVPFTRGPERSRTSESVLKEARDLAQKGYLEIQLLGQNVNSYRDPSPADWDFTRLLRAMGEVDGIRRVRFTTSHPRDFVKDIVDAIDENPVLCNHVHLPVQSGASSVLDRMQRLYTRDDYLRRIEWMKNARRNIAITPTSSSDFREKPSRSSTRHFRCSKKYNTIRCSISNIRAGPTRPPSRLRIKSRRRKRPAVSPSFRRCSAPFRSAGIPRWSVPSRRPSWKAIIRPRVNGLVEPLKIGRSTSFIRSFPAHAMEPLLRESFQTSGSRVRVQTRWPASE